MFNYDGEPNAAFWYVVDIDKKLPRHKEEDELDPRLKKKYPEGYKPLIVPVYEGTAKIDGVMDDAYNKAEVMPIVKVAEGKNPATGTARLLWDDNYLYTYVEVTDPTPDATHAEPWFRDNCEIFLSESNMHVTWRGGGDYQFRVDPTGTVERYPAGDAVAITTDTGYIYETRIEFLIKKPEPGIMYSYDIGIADARDGMREAIAKWCDVTNNSYQRTIYWGDIIISDGTTPVPKVDIGFEDVEDTSVSATQTGNNKPAELVGNYFDYKLNYLENETSYKILDNNSSAMVGMRDFLNLTDASVTTNINGTVSISLNGTKIDLALDNNVAVVNGNMVAMPSPATVVDAKTWLPLRFIFENCGLKVNFDGENGAILVTE